MPAKPESSAPAAAASSADPAPAKPGSGLVAWLPAVMTILLAPVATWALAQYVLLPRLRASLMAEASSAASTPTPGEAAVSGEQGKEGRHGPRKPGTAADGTSYRFENVVVNLAGTMGTRYLKSTFVVTGTDAALALEFEKHQTQLVDVTLNVLSSLSLADLEEAGAKNLIREKLVAAYNQALGRRVAEQVYFSDFVVQ